MRSLIFALALLPTVAAAAEIQIDGIFGTPAACAAFIKEGADGMSGVGDDDVLVTRAAVMGREWECGFTAVRGTNVSLACGTAGDEGKSVAAKASITQAPDGLVYNDTRNPALTLARCGASKP